MQVLLRSTFRVDPNDDLSLLLSNALELRQSNLEFLTPEHDAVWSFVRSFVSDRNHVPDITSLVLHFTQTAPNPDVMNQLQLLRGLAPITRGDFKKRLATKVEERKTVITEELLKYANLINRKGVEVVEGAAEGGRSQKKILKGYRDALRYVTGKSLEISRPTTGIRKEGEATTDTKQFIEDYDRRRADPTYGRGQLCGIEQFDVAIGGARKDQLWTHAAFTGELKCLVGGTLIQDAETGRLHTVRELFQEGLRPMVQCLDETSWEMSIARIAHVVENALVPIFKVTTTTGRSIRTSGNHPFMTAKGWLNAEELFRGLLVAASSEWPNAAETYPVWETVISVVPDGLEVTYDLSVPGPENFVANGFIVHNSTFAFNWVYNQAIYFGYSSCFFSLEMPYDQCQRIVYTMHSLHPKFQEARLDLGVQKEPHIPVPISYPYLRDGRLTPGEEQLLKHIVLPDLEEGSAKGAYGKMHFRGYDPDSDYFRVSDIRAKGETLYRENPFSLLIVDHVLLVDSKRRHASTTESANEVVRDLKKLSETFNAGEGIALLALFQMSREGKKRADKADGRYNLYDLSYSNEIERSSDVITASYLNDELRKRCRGLFQFLKARDGGMCEPFFTRIDWPTRMLFTCHDSPSDDTGDVVEEVEGTRFEDVLS